MGAPEDDGSRGENDDKEAGSMVSFRASPDKHDVEHRTPVSLHPARSRSMEVSGSAVIAGMMCSDDSSQRDCVQQSEGSDREVRSNRTFEETDRMKSPTNEKSSFTSYMQSFVEALRPRRGNPLDAMDAASMPRKCFNDDDRVTSSISDMSVGNDEDDHELGLRCEESSWSPQERRRDSHVIFVGNMPLCYDEKEEERLEEPHDEDHNHYDVGWASDVESELSIDKPFSELTADDDRDRSCSVNPSAVFLTFCLIGLLVVMPVFVVMKQSLANAPAVATSSTSLEESLAPSAAPM